MKTQLIYYCSFQSKETALNWMRDNNKRNPDKKCFLIKGKISICYSNVIVEGFTMARIEKI